MSPERAQDPDGEERFQARTAPRALVEAVREFCAASGRTMDEMEQHTPHEIFQFAEQHYGDPLPEFWRVWKDWHEGDEVQPMGDL